MFKPMQLPSDLPPVGAGREHFAFDMKAVGIPAKTFEMAKDMAAFANSTGGTILIGAVESRNSGTLESYRPMPESEANRLAKAFSEAAKDRCHPTPFIDPTVIACDNGFVVAVNVWPFPAQPVGVHVRADASDGFGGESFVFPLRSGIDTKFIRAEHLPMFMLPEVRRRAIMLDSIPAAARSGVVLESPTDARPVALVEIDLLANSFTVDWRRAGQHIKFAMPIDAVRHVWRNANGEWRVAVQRYVLDGDGNVTIN